MAALDPTARGILAEGRQLYVGVLPTSGPHVTPELYAAPGDDLWFATASSTLKARVLRRNPRASAVVRVGARSLVVTGDVAAFDMADPKSLATDAKGALEALLAVGAFGVRNAADLGAFAFDLVAGRLGSRIPPRRVLLRLRPDRWLTLDGTELTGLGGDWPGRVAAPDAAPTLPGSRDAVVGWATDDGVLVLPGRSDEASAAVPAVVAQLAGVDDESTGPACLVTDEYNGPGPAAKTGTLLRGMGTLQYAGPVARVTVDVDRETTWDGARTQTVPRAARGA